MRASDQVPCVNDDDPECSFRWYLVPILTAVSRERGCCTGHACRHFRLLDKEGKEVGLVEFDCMHDAEGSPGEALEMFTCVVLGHGANWGRRETSWSLLVTRRVDDGADVRLNHRLLGQGGYPTHLGSLNYLILGSRWYNIHPPTLKRVGVGNVEWDEMLGCKRGLEKQVILI